jgi:hypothetical protein
MAGKTHQVLLEGATRNRRCTGRSTVALSLAAFAPVKQIVMRHKYAPPSLRDGHFCE